ncbi:hypothetical protein SO694_0000839 [Aureococcus anophagefferens]|uniref:C2 NT-type domain-containing protein n=1 Tax=Aureococcus anophagefferens TaxID=44056 RepID=A0ABR1GE93_AURAN
MEVPWSVQVHISALKNLPSSFVSELGSRNQFTLRVQGQLNGVSRETASSSWGARHTPRAGEAVWAGDGGLLEWRFGSEEAFRAAEKAAPVLKLYCYATLGGPGVGATPTNSKAPACSTPSFELLGVVVQSEQFGALTLDNPRFAVECDWFRLRCRCCPWRSDGDEGPAEFRFAAPHLGQRGVAKTARLEFDTTTVACRGLGAVSHFEFRATANQLRMTLAPALFEAVDAATRQLLGSAKVKLAAVLDAPGDPRAQFGDKAPRSGAWAARRTSSSESQVRDGSLLFGSLATRVALQRVDPNQLAKPNLDGARAPSAARLSRTSKTACRRRAAAARQPERVGAHVAGAAAAGCGARDRSGTSASSAGPGSSGARAGGQAAGPGDGCCRYCGAAQPSLQEVADLKQELTLAFEAERRNWEAWRADEERAWALRVAREGAADPERALGDADAAMKRERASKVLDLQMLEKRLRDESKHSIEAEVRARKAVEKALSARGAPPTAEKRARCKRTRLRPRAKDDAADRARRDLDELKLEYKGKEERFAPRRRPQRASATSRRARRARRRHVADEDRAKVAKNAAMEAVHYAMRNAPASPRRAPRRAAAPVAALFDDAALDAINGNAAYAGGAAIPPRGAPVDDADNLARAPLQRAVLVDEAGYPENDPLVRDLDRLIQAAAAE